ncbi:hypothetical protein HUT11_20980 [Streptomyces seoulensis]|nr:hypothetical protein HUT11_20980 [Streptomyces seoulensis]
MAQPGRLGAARLDPVAQLARLGEIAQELGPAPPPLGVALLDPESPQGGRLNLVGGLGGVCGPGRRVRGSGRVCGPGRRVRGSGGVCGSG